MNPVGAVLHRSEPADRVARKAGRDRRVGAVAQESERDVHPDLRPGAGQQGPPSRQVGALIAFAAVEGGALGAELVIERVDIDIPRLAGVAGAWLQESACECAGGARHQLKALGLVVDPLRGAGSRQCRDGAIVCQYLLAARSATSFLDSLVDSRRRSSDGHGVGVLRRKRVNLRQDVEAELQISGRYAGLARRVAGHPGRGVVVLGHPETVRGEAAAAHFGESTPGQRVSGSRGSERAQP